MPRKRDAHSEMQHAPPASEVIDRSLIRCQSHGVRGHSHGVLQHGARFNNQESGAGRGKRGDDTVRGTLAGTFKKKLSLEITSTKETGTERVYKVVT